MEEQSAPPEAINGAFHALYDAARIDASRGAPVLVVMADAIVVCRGHDEQAFPLSHGEFHAIKAIAHAPVAAYAALQRDSATRGGSLDASTREALTALRRGARLALPALDGRADAFAADAREVLERSLVFIDSVLARQRAVRAEVDAFARECGALLERLTRQGTRAQLASLDAAVRAALETMSPEELRALQVVVTGDHQARVRSLAMQYFQKRFGEAPGAEVRVTYGEGISTTAEARALVGTRRLDRIIAAAFFGDAKRLQRDVLGDAAEALLAETDFMVIGD